MTSVPVVRYRIDRHDRLTDIGDGWLAFAEANCGEALQASRILGRSLWDFLADATTKQLYHAMVHSVREGGLPVRFRFRCDAAARRRLLSMEIIAVKADAVQFTVTSVTEEARPAVPLLDPGHPRGDDFLTMCSWCKRIRVPQGSWVEVEDVVRELGLFGGDPLPGVTHGMCEACYAAIVFALDNPAAGAGSVTVGAIP